MAIRRQPLFCEYTEVIDRDPAIAVAIRGARFQSRAKGAGERAALCSVVAEFVGAAGGDCVKAVRNSAVLGEKLPRVARVDEQHDMTATGTAQLRKDEIRIQGGCRRIIASGVVEQKGKRAVFTLYTASGVIDEQCILLVASAQTRATSCLTSTRPLSRRTETSKRDPSGSERAALRFLASFAGPGSRFCGKFRKLPLQINSAMRLGRCSGVFAARFAMPHPFLVVSTADPLPEHPTAHRRIDRSSK